jgi:hypothetical protein
MHDSVKRKRFWPCIALATLLAAATAVFLLLAWQASRDGLRLPDGELVYVLRTSGEYSARSYLIAAAISGLLAAATFAVAAKRR